MFPILRLVSKVLIMDEMNKMMLVMQMVRIWIKTILVAVSWSDIGPFLIAQFRPGQLPMAHPRRSHLARQEPL